MVGSIQDNITYVIMCTHVIYNKTLKFYLALYIWVCVKILPFY